MGAALRAGRGAENGQSVPYNQPAPSNSEPARVASRSVSRRRPRPARGGLTRAPAGCEWRREERCPPGRAVDGKREALAGAKRLHHLGGVVAQFPRRHRRAMAQLRPRCYTSSQITARARTESRSAARSRPRSPAPGPRAARRRSRCGSSRARWPPRRPAPAGHPGSPQRGLLVDLEAHAVAERVEEAVDQSLTLRLGALSRLTRRLEHVARPSKSSRPVTPGAQAASASSSAVSESSCQAAMSSAGSPPATKVRVMSLQQPVRSSRGQMSTMSGTPAGIGPLPFSWPLAPARRRRR